MAVRAYAFHQVEIEENIFIFRFHSFRVSVESVQSSLAVRKKRVFVSHFWGLPPIFGYYHCESMERLRDRVCLCVKEEGREVVGGSSRAHFGYFSRW